MNAMGRQVEFSNNKSQKTLGKSLEKLEHKYLVALQEWQQTKKQVAEKNIPQVLGTSNHLPKRLPKLVTLSEVTGSMPLEQVSRKQLVKVLSECRIQEMQVRALEHTLESHRKKLESERSQQHHLQQQLQTLLYKEEEIQKLMQKVKADLHREAPSVEIAERKLSENAERIANIDEEVVGIRRDATELIQMRQVRGKVHEQVETFRGRITALEVKKTKVLDRASSLHEEETKHFQDMNVAIRKVCAGQFENAVEVDGKHHVLWSNVELLLGCCHKLLQMTRPEVEALIPYAHQADESNHTHQRHTSAAHSQTEIIDNSEVTSANAHQDVPASQAQPLVQDEAQHDDVSQVADSLTGSRTEGVHDKNQMSADNGNCSDGEDTGIHQESLTEDQHEGDTEAHKQEPEAATFQPLTRLVKIRFQHPLADQNKFDHNTHPFEELLTKSPSSPLPGKRERTNITEDSCLPAFHGDGSSTSVEDEGVQASISLPTAHQNVQTMINEKFHPRVFKTGKTFSSMSHFPQSCASHASTSSIFCTICTSHHIKSRAASEKTFSAYREESQRDEKEVVILEVTDEKEVDASDKQTENLPLFDVNQKNSIVNASSPDMEAMPNNTVIVLTEEHYPQISSLHPDTCNQLISASVNNITTVKVKGGFVSSTS